jgi:hypothetical protein
MIIPIPIPIPIQYQVPSEFGASEQHFFPPYEKCNSKHKNVYDTEKVREPKREKEKERKWTGKV